MRPHDVGEFEILLHKVYGTLIHKEGNQCENVSNMQKAVSQISFSFVGHGRFENEKKKMIWVVMMYPV